MNGKENNFRVWNAKFEKAVGKDALPSVQMARNYFLKAIAEHAPEVLQDLCCESFRLFRATDLYSGMHRPRMIWKEIEKPYKSPFAAFYLKPTRRDIRIKRFAQSLFRWSIKHNLDAFWCRQTAFETLNNWCSLPEAAPKFNFSLTVPIPAPVNNTLEEISLVSYDGDSPEDFLKTYKVIENVWSAKDANGLNRFNDYETGYPSYGVRADEEKAILEFFEKKEKPVNRVEVREFLNQCEAMARGNGFSKTPRLHTLQHFEWLALFQCTSVSKRGLERYLKKSRNVNFKTVWKTLKDLSKLIDLALKPEEKYAPEAKRGRPKKVFI